MGPSDSPPDSGLPNLPATNWAVLGMLAFGEEVSGYDIKKWADWSVGHFYWSPSFSQIYSELKRLEAHGYATSRVEHDNGPRERRIYQITETGRAAAGRWVDEAPVDAPMLKHGVLLRVWLGHLSEPDRLKEILEEHIAHMDRMRHRVAIDSRAANLEAAWAYPRIAMRWSARYYAAERELALQLIKDIDEADAALGRARRDAHGDDFPALSPGRWREVEKRAQATGPTAD